MRKLSQLLLKPTEVELGLQVGVEFDKKNAKLWNLKKFKIFCQTLLQLANPTQLQLVGEGVDFVFPRKEGRKEGRKKKNEEEPTPSF